MKGEVIVRTKKWVYRIPFSKCYISVNDTPDDIPPCGYTVEIKRELMEAVDLWKRVEENLRKVADKELGGDGM